MKKILATITTLIIVFIGAIIILSLLPVSSESDIYDDFMVDNGYEILSADYDIKVSSDHTASVTEVLKVKYYLPSNGIIRYLPTNSGEQYYNITVDALDDGDIYFVESDINFITINTGESITSNRYKRYQKDAEQTYIIKYRIVPPMRTINKTYYYMNVVPFGWTTSQSDVNVTMQFPFAIKEAEVYAGKYGITDTSDDYVISDDGCTLSMHLDFLAPFSGVSINAEMGRRFNANFSAAGFASIIMILALIAASVCVKLFWIKDRFVVPVLNAKPPQNNGMELDPAQTGYLIDGNCEPQDITAMIFYFASKGLLRLEEVGKDNFKLIKTGELDSSAPQHQLIVFNGLFKGGRQSVTTAQLQNRFYNDIASATSHLKSEYVGRLYEPKATTISIGAAIISVLLAMIVVLVASLGVDPTLIQHGAIFPCILMAVFTAAGYMFGRYIFDYKHKLAQRKLLTICLLGGVIAIIASIIASYFVLGGILPFYGRVIIYGGLMTTGFVCGLIRRKTEYYSNLMNEIMGFRTFLETAEKDRLEAMLEENPQYYYDILPYANVLGVSEKWENKFKGLTNVPPPSYYYGPSLFDFMIFNSMINRSFKSFTTAMVSRPSSSSHSGGGVRRGGGGGGFGGGGGGRR